MTQEVGVEVALFSPSAGATMGSQDAAENKNPKPCSPREKQTITLSKLCSPLQGQMGSAGGEGLCGQSQLSVQRHEGHRGKHEAAWRGSIAGREQPAQGPQHDSRVPGEFWAWQPSSGWRGEDSSWRQRVLVGIHS